MEGAEHVRGNVIKLDGVVPGPFVDEKLAKDTGVITQDPTKGTEDYGFTRVVFRYGYRDNSVVGGRRGSKWRIGAKYGLNGGRIGSHFD